MLAELGRQARTAHDFFVKYLRGIDPPNWNDVPVNPTAGNGLDEELAM